MSRALQPPCVCTERHVNGISYLEVVVLVDGASGVRGDVGHGRHVHVLAGEEEEIHTAALRHTLLRQLLVHSFLRLEQSLKEQKSNNCSWSFLSPALHLTQ